MADRVPEEEERCSQCSCEAEDDCSGTEAEEEEDVGEEEEDRSAAGDTQPGPSPETQAVLDVTRRQREEAETVQRRRTLLKKNQVIAALHFIRRFKMFIKFIVKYQPLLCGKLTDWVIRYETQGRGSLHAHVLWWIEMNPGYIGPLDHVDIPPEVLERFHLYEVVNEALTNGGDDHAEKEEEANGAEGGTEGDEEADGTDGDADDESDAAGDDETAESTGANADGDGESGRRRRKKKKEKKKVYDEIKLDFTNGNIWAIKKPENLKIKLNIGMRDPTTLR